MNKRVYFLNSLLNKKLSKAGSWETATNFESTILILSIKDGLLTSTILASGKWVSTYSLNGASSSTRLEINYLVWWFIIPIFLSLLSNPDISLIDCIFFLVFSNLSFYFSNGWILRSFYFLSSVQHIGWIEIVYLLKSCWWLFGCLWWAFLCSEVYCSRFPCWKLWLRIVGVTCLYYIFQHRYHNPSKTWQNYDVYVRLRFLQSDLYYQQRLFHLQIN